MIPYPTKAEVLSADRKQIYRWFLLLRLPGFSKWDKKSGTFVSDPTVPANADEIIKMIAIRWLEFGGRDIEMSIEIMKEVKNDAPAGPDTPGSKINAI